MLAGDVRAQLINGTLFINEAAGSAGFDQAVQVFQLANGKIRVQGMFSQFGGQTKINGDNSVDFAHPNDLKISLGGGRDQVSVHDANFRNVQILTGDTFGNGANDSDEVVVHHVQTTGSLDVRTGAGADNIFLLFNNVGGDLNVDSGLNGVPGDTDKDGVFLQNMFVQGTATIRTGAGDDFVGVRLSNFGNDISDELIVDTGAGADRVEFGPAPDQSTGPVVLAGNLIVSMGSDAEQDKDVLIVKDVAADGDIGINVGGGDDRVEMTFALGRAIGVQTFSGNDTVVLTQVEAADSLFAKLGEGDDGLILTEVDALHLLFDGGSGFDKLSRDALPPNRDVTIAGWEEINGVRVLNRRGVVPNGVLTMAR